MSLIAALPCTIGSTAPEHTPRSQALAWRKANEMNVLHLSTKSHHCNADICSHWHEEQPQVSSARLRPPQQGARSSRMTKELSATRKGSAATTRKHMRGDSLCTIRPTTAALTTLPTACHAAARSQGIHMLHFV